MDKYLLALSQVDGLGPVTLKKLISLFGSAEALFRASAFELKRRNLLPQLLKLIVEGQRSNPDEALAQIKKHGLSVCSFYEEDYPALLKEIYDPPLILYYRGDLSIAGNYLSLAVVGSRRISAYARQIMPKILEAVINTGVTIVSGLAYGVDQLAHELTLEHAGKTIAVLGNGLAWDMIYPPSNVRLANKILEQSGLLMAELPPRMESLPYNFPRRNRIISGLAKATLIVEAAQKSGALITAACAAEQNRDVLAVPQNINSSTSAGVNGLIKNGAKAITEPEDILEIYNIKTSVKNQNPLVEKILAELGLDEKNIYQCLGSGPVHIDKIIENSNLSTSLVNGLLIQLEIKGLVKNLGNQNYIQL